MFLGTCSCVVSPCDIGMRFALDSVISDIENSDSSLGHIATIVRWKISILGRDVSWVSCSCAVPYHDLGVTFVLNSVHLCYG